MAFVIDDSTKAVKFKPPSGRGKGLELNRRGPGEYAYGSAADKFPKSLLIPRSEFQARIKEKEELGNRISDHLKANGIGPKDQQQTNFCWMFGPVMAFMIRRMMQGQAFVQLSPASAAARIKNFRNEGGWGKEALQYISDKGVCTSERWPDTVWNDRSLATPEATQEALDYRCPEWMELGARNTDQLISCLLHDIPVAVGYNWWGHEVCAVDPVWQNGTVAIRIINSWGLEFGEEGYAVLAGNKMLPDDAVAPRTAIAI